MGNDGGSIPKRRELVKSAARTPTVSELKATALESLSHAWSHDPLTSDLLNFESLVSDWRGHLYNYETILNALVPKDDDDTTSPALVNGESPESRFASTGIRSLRDIVKLKFKRYEPPDSKEREIWACPVSLKELGPSTKAVYLVPCGHVFAEAAVKHMQEETCPECSEPFKPSDVIPILPTEQTDIERLMARMDNLKARGLAHSLKKDKSAGKKKRKADESKAEDETTSAEKGKERGKHKDSSTERVKSDIASRVSGINNAMTASLTAKVLAEQEERNKRRKLALQA